MFKVYKPIGWVSNLETLNIKPYTLNRKQKGYTCQQRKGFCLLPMKCLPTWS